MMSAIVAAAEANNITVEGASGGYISDINGLAAFDGSGAQSGWMGTLSDWFVNAGFANFTAESGDLRDGDVIRVMYSNAEKGGEDLGATWYNNNKALAALGFSVGTLSPAFDGATTSYTLALPEGTDSVTVMPTAANKNFQVRIKTRVENSSNVHWGARTLTLQPGDTIDVICGAYGWPSMNNGDPPTGSHAETVPAVDYRITVSASSAPAVQTPTFSNDLSTAPVSYTAGQSAFPLTVAATVTDAGAVTYQWYSNTANSAEGGTAVGTGSSYTPSTAAAGTTYYYAVATNTLGEGTATAASSVATVTVTAP